MTCHGCNVTTCPNGKCQATGECIEAAAERALQRFQTPVAAPDLRYVASPPLIPNFKYRYPSDDAQPRTIIAFTGVAGTGKSTAAMHLVTHHGFRRVRFAGPLKAMLAALGCTQAEIDGDRKEMPCELLDGKTPRHAMQTLGTEWGRQLIGDGLWIRAWKAAIDAQPIGAPVVVDDCRFPNEAAAIVAAGGVIVRIERPGAGTDFVHASEQHVLPFARALQNIGSEAELGALVDALLQEELEQEMGLPLLRGARPA